MDKKGKGMQKVLLFRKERREISSDDKFLVRVYGDYRLSMTLRNQFILNTCYLQL